jgi:predicted transcriptional regulator
MAFRRLRETAKRGRVVEVVGQHHGITKAEICRLTGLSWGTVSHHVRQLHRLGELRLQPTDRRVYLFRSTVQTEQMTLMRLMRDETTQRIMDQVRANPGIGIQEVSRALSTSRKIIRRYMADLVDVEILSKTDDYRPKFTLRDQAPSMAPELRLLDVLRRP